VSKQLLQWLGLEFLKITVLPFSIPVTVPVMEIHLFQLFANENNTTTKSNKIIFSLLIS
jgi:hypothetical protein